MKDFKKVVMLNDKKYNLVFNINVAADIQEKYGSIQNCLNKVKSNNFDNVDIAAFRFLITQMLNEGIEIENEDLSVESQKPLFKEKQVGRLISNFREELSTAATSTIEKSIEIESNPNV